MKTAEETLKSFQGNSAYIHEDDAIGAINEYAEQFKPKWIPVSERLPEYNGSFLIAVPNTGLHGYHYVLSIYTSMLGFIDNRAKFWQHLPLPPQQ